MNGLALDCKERRVLGDDVDIEISALDETNTRVRPDRIARRLRRRKWHGRAGRRAVESISARHGYRARLARRGRSRSASAASTFPAVSRCCPSLTPELKEAMDLGISLFAGEAEGRFDASSARRLERHAEAALQLHGRSAVARRRHAAHASGFPHQAHRRQPHQFRRRPRLPVSVLLLHHHQRAGPEIAASLGGRRSSGSSGAISRRASTAFSSPTIISRATRTGKTFSTA